MRTKPRAQWPRLRGDHPATDPAKSNDVSGRLFPGPARKPRCTAWSPSPGPLNTSPDADTGDNDADADAEGHEPNSNDLNGAGPRPPALGQTPGVKGGHNAVGLKIRTPIPGRGASVCWNSAYVSAHDLTEKTDRQLFVPVVTSLLNVPSRKRPRWGQPKKSLGSDIRLG